MMEQTKEEQNSLFGRIESILYVAGDPVPIPDLSRVLLCPQNELIHFLRLMEEHYRNNQRGIIPVVTEQTVQLVTNTAYAETIELFLKPEQTKNVSKSVLETLAVIAYKQPVTRADIESVRGVRCDYAVTQLLGMGFIEQCGKKDVLGHPALFQTTDLFLRKFGLHSRQELPGFAQFGQTESEQETDAFGTV